VKLFLKYSLCFFLLWIALYTDAQQETYPRDEYFNSKISERPFDQSTWEKTIEGIDYTTGIEKERAKDKEDGNEASNTNERYFEHFDSVEINSAWGSIMQIFFILILVLMLAFVIYNVLKGENIFKRKAKKITNTTTFDLEKIEENIHESDLEKFIKQAEAEGKYNLAIRLYYLAIIKELSLSKLIKWKRNKTNRSYLSELGNSPFRSGFKKATIIFERVWYGDGLLEQKDYLVLKPQFQQWATETKNIGAANI